MFVHCNRTLGNNSPIPDGRVFDGGNEWVESSVTSYGTFFLRTIRILASIIRLADSRRYTPEDNPLARSALKQHIPFKTED